MLESCPGDKSNSDIPRYRQTIEFDENECESVMIPSSDRQSNWGSISLVVLAGGLILGLTYGIRHAQGLFLLPISMDRGWAREVFGFAVAVQNLVWGLAQPLTGMLADRYGSMRVIAAGLVLYVLGLVLMAHAVTPAEFTMTAGVCIGLALSGSAFSVVYGALSRIVTPARRSSVLGLAGAIGGLVQFFMVPATLGLIDEVGWVGALLALAAICALFLPCTLALRDRPIGHGAVKLSFSAAIGEAFRHRGFLLLNAGFLVCGFQLAFIATHLPAYLLDKGMTARDAVAGLAIIALTNIAGTYCSGRFGDIYRIKHLLCWIYLVRSFAMALFAMLPLTVTSLYSFCAVMGFVWLGTVPLTNALVSQVFGVRYITTLFGFVFLSHQIGSFFGVWLGGLVFDTTNSYDLIWFGGIALGLIAAAVHYPIDDREIVRHVPTGVTS